MTGNVDLEGINFRATEESKYGRRPEGQEDVRPGSEVEKGFLQVGQRCRLETYSRA